MKMKTILFLLVTCFTCYSSGQATKPSGVVSPLKVIDVCMDPFNLYETNNLTYPFSFTIEPTDSYLESEGLILSIYRSNKIVSVPFTLELEVESSDGIVIVPKNKLTLQTDTQFSRRLLSSRNMEDDEFSESNGRGLKFKSFKSKSKFKTKKYVTKPNSGGSSSYKSKKSPTSPNKDISGRQFVNSGGRSYGYSNQATLQQRYPKGNSKAKYGYFAAGAVAGGATMYYLHSRPNSYRYYGQSCYYDSYCRNNNYYGNHYGESSYNRCQSEYSYLDDDCTYKSESGMTRDDVFQIGDTGAAFFDESFPLTITIYSVEVDCVRLNSLSESWEPKIMIGLATVESLDTATVGFIVTVLVIIGLVICCCMCCAIALARGLFECGKDKTLDSSNYGGFNGQYQQPQMEEDNGQPLPNQGYYNGAPPPNQGYNGAPPPNQGYYNGAPPPNQGYNGAPPPNQGYYNGAPPTKEGYYPSITQ